jgi:hypothetical protein
LLDVLRNIFPRAEAVSKSKKESGADYTIYTIVGPLYKEEAFQYLLTSESKRSVRSGYSFNVLLICSIDKQGLLQYIDRDVNNTLVGALFRAVRETDYIGWYLGGRIVGAVLTVLGRDSEVEVSTRIQQRVMGILRTEISAEKYDRLQIRICQHHELEGIQSGEGIFKVN